MKLTEIYEKGKEVLKRQDYNFALDAVETEFVMANNRRVLDRYTFLQQCIDGTEPTTHTSVLGVELKTPVIMSAMTMPIPAIAEEGLMKVARGLKEAGSLMWTGTPVPKELKALAETGVPLAATVKPLKNRKRMFETLEEIQEAGVHWAGIEIDVGQGTKIKDRPIIAGCTPMGLAELKEVRKEISAKMIVKGVLSRQDAEKCIEAGADGIMVSNHGGHTIDYLPHPFQVMDDIMEIARDRIVVMVDGGFRRGSDVCKGLAFGASLVGLGRPILWAVAAGGQEGVKSLVEEITEELRRIMGMIGARDPQAVPRDCLLES
ncbi:MAG: alpha-hydroxy-acid oxidizing protein [Deltaproteobacteria bacterium]|nr:alpha-hydroxy-acid oxidizing protein [Deltaproteobacteria bacterium]